MTILEDFDKTMPSLYNDYLNTMSPMAPSLKTLRLLLSLCTPGDKVLDLGSGFSSFMLRYYAPQLKLKVFSVDDSETWLDKTIVYCAKQKVSVASFYTLEWFKEEIKGVEEMIDVSPGLYDPVLPFDVVFVDIGITKNRPKYYPLILRDWCIPWSMVLIDDMHKGVLSTALHKELGHYDYIDIDVYHQTLDGFGRYCSLITRLRPKRRGDIIG